MWSYFCSSLKVSPKKNPQKGNCPAPWVTQLNMMKRMRFSQALQAMQKVLHWARAVPGWEKDCMEGLGGCGGWKTGHEPTVCTPSPEGELNPGLCHKQGGQGGREGIVPLWDPACSARPALHRTAMLGLSEQVWKVLVGLELLCSRTDWQLQRRRLWGHPIAAFLREGECLLTRAHSDRTRENSLNKLRWAIQISIKCQEEFLACEGGTGCPEKLWKKYPSFQSVSIVQLHFVLHLNWVISVCAEMAALGTGAELCCVLARIYHHGVHAVIPLLWEKSNNNLKLLSICCVMKMVWFICSMGKSGCDEFKDYVSASGAYTISPGEYCDKKWGKKTLYSM